MWLVSLHQEEVRGCGSVVEHTLSMCEALGSRLGQTGAPAQRKERLPQQSGQRKTPTPPPWHGLPPSITMRKLFLLLFCYGSPSKRIYCAPCCKGIYIVQMYGYISSSLGLGFGRNNLRQDLKASFFWGARNLSLMLINVWCFSQHRRDFSTNTVT